MKKSIGILFTLIGAFAIYVFISKGGLWETKKPFQKFEALWNKDIDQLTKANQQPKGWDNIGTMEFIAGQNNPEIRNWLGIIKPNIPMKVGGKNKIEVMVDKWEEDGESGVLVEYHITDLKSQNVISYFSRTYILGKSPKN